MARKSFTVEEANALIPLLEHALRQIGERRETIRERTDKLQVLDAIWGAGVAARSNPDHGEYLEHRAEIARALADVQRIVNDEIMERGLRFPARRPPPLCRGPERSRRTRRLPNNTGGGARPVFIQRFHTRTVTQEESRYAFTRSFPRKRESSAGSPLSRGRAKW